MFLMSFNVFLIVLISFLYPFMIYVDTVKNKIPFFLQTDDEAECIETFHL